MKGIGTALLSAFGLAVLLLFASQAWSLWRGFSPLEVPVHRAREDTTYRGMSPEELGQAVLTSQGCLACHQLDLRGGALAPSLDNVGVRRSSPQWLRRQITNPQGVVPGTTMPGYTHLSEEELKDLIGFLLTLTPRRRGPTNEGTWTLKIPERFTEAQVERGRELFIRQGCMGCHQVNGVVQGGQVGPNLTHEARRGRSDRWQLQHLKDPLSVYTVGESGAGWIMPAYAGLRPEELEDLVAFLQSLR